MVYFGKNKVQFVKKYKKFKTQKIGLSGLFNYSTYFNEENIGYLDMYVWYERITIMKRSNCCSVPDSEERK